MSKTIKFIEECPNELLNKIKFQIKDHYFKHSKFPKISGLVVKGEPRINVDFTGTIPAENM